MNKKISKKSAIEVQFNWIFVLIVGGIVLFFFASIVMNQKKSAEKSINQDVLGSMYSVVTSASVNLGSTNQIRLPKHEVNIECDKISVKQESKNFDNAVLFAPNNVKGRAFITQTVDFSMPMRATNIILGSSDEIKYIFWIGGTDAFENEVYERISELKPDEKKIGFKKQKTKDALNLINEKNYKVRFIFFNVNLPDNSVLSKFADMKDEDVTAVVVLTNDNKIKYFKKEGGVWNGDSITEVYYFQNSLLGAIFIDAGDKTEEEYQCVMEGIIKRAKFIAEIYLKKAEELKINPTIAQCNSDYKSAAMLLKKVVSSATDEEALINIKNLNDGLPVINQNLQEQSCPLVY